MRTTASAIAIAIGLGLAAASSASAQEVGIYVGPSGGGIYAYDDEPAYAPPYAYGPRVYGYSSRAIDDDDDVEFSLRTRPGGCGTYHYWDGSRCVDARYR
jgi:hypothetical protein